MNAPLHAEAPAPLRLFQRALAFTEGAALKLSSLMLILLVVLVNVEVFGRSFFNYSTEIADEYGGYMYAWIVLLGSVHLLRSDRYLTMTMVTDRLSPRAQAVIGMIGSFVGLAVAVISLWGCWQVWEQSVRFGTRSSQPSETRLYYPQFMMLVGYGMLVLAYIEEIACRALGMQPRRASDDEETYGVGEVS